MNKNSRVSMIVGLFILSFIVLVSAQVITNDQGDNKIITVNNTVFNFTATPHRFGNTGFITLNIKTDKRINKTFTFKHNNQTDYTIDMNDSNSVSYNTPMFNVVDGCNETLTLDEFNLTLNTMFHTQEISLLNIINFEAGSPVTINPNDSIQTAINNSNPGDTILLNGGVYNQTNINVTKENLTIKASGSGGVPIIDGRSQGRGFNVSSGGVTIQDLTITNITNNITGGGVYILGTNGSVIGCSFTNIKASWGGGVGINGSDCSVSGCSFINTTASNYGGGVQMNGANGSVSGCSFTNTTSNDGGGIYINGSGGSVSGCSFTNTTTHSIGGGVFMVGNNVGGNSVSGCSFTNTTGGDGGGVAIAWGNGSVIGCSFTNTTANVGGGVYIGEGNVIGCNFTNTTTIMGYGGGVYMGSGGSVIGCNFTNATASNYGGGGVAIFWGNGSVSDCNFINNTAPLGGGIYLYDSDCSVVFNRFVNNTDNGTMVSNGVYIDTGSCNVSSNWWGNNTPQNITNGLMEDYYQVELSANQAFMRYLNNSSVNRFVPVPLGYRMVLNGSNNTGNIANLPDFNATIKLNNNNLFRSNNNFRSDIGLLRFSPFMSPGDSFDVLAKDPWRYTINNPGNYTFSALVDNQQLNLNINATDNTSLNLTANNIPYGNNTSISATLTDSNGSILSNRTIIFNINGNNYTSTTTTITDGSGVATFNIGGLHAGVYNVSASFNGDADYNPSTSNTIFNVGERSNNGDGNDTNTNGGGMDGDTNGFDQTFFKSLTGFPLILLVLLCVLGFVYYRQK